MGSLRLSPERSSERWEGGHPGLCRSKPLEERSLGSLEPLPPFLPAVFDILRPTQGLSAKSHSQETNSISSHFRRKRTQVKEKKKVNSNYRKQKRILPKQKTKNINSSSHLPVRNLLQPRETWRISDEHYSGASHPITSKLWSDVRRGNWRANMYESLLTGLHICNNCLIQATRK